YTLCLHDALPISCQAGGSNVSCKWGSVGSKGAMKLARRAIIDTITKMVNPNNPVLLSANNFNVINNLLLFDFLFFCPSVASLKETPPLTIFNSWVQNDVNDVCNQIDYNHQNRYDKYCCLHDSHITKVYSLYK